MNGSHEGTRRISGPRFPRIGYLSMLQMTKAHPHYTAPLEGILPGSWRGRWLLAQQHGSRLCDHQRQRRRHSESGGEVDGHWWRPSSSGDACR